MRQAKGKIIFSRTANGNKLPVQHMRVELWDLDVIKNDFLARGVTDEKGRFLLEYDPNDAGARWGDKPDLILRLLDREYTYDRDGSDAVQSDWKVVASFEGASNVTAAVYDFGTLKAAYWEYEDKGDLTKVAFTPRVAVVENRVPQSARTGHTIAQTLAALANGPQVAKFKLINKFNDDRPSLKDLNAYEPNLTRTMGSKAAESDAYLAELVLNGFNPCIPEKIGKDYVVSFRWDGLTLDDRHFSPNTTARFRLKNGKLILKSIAVRKRYAGNNGAHAKYRPERIYTPKSGAKVWRRVKRLFRVNYFAFGEVATHLTGTHLNIEQYNVAVRRHLHQSPIAQLLLPHFYGTVAVNLGANDLLITQNGLVGKGSALTPDSVEHVCQTHLGTMNWAGWTPRKPLCKSHRFAKLAQLFWETLGNYLDGFFAANAAAIADNWSEVLSLSDELVRRAVPFVATANDAYDCAEQNRDALGHPVEAGVPVAVSRLTSTATPQAGEVDDLKQMCRYVLYHATFLHSWVNDSQYDIGGDVGFASLGVVGDLTDLEVDDTTAVPADEALLQPFITHLLAYTKYGYIVRNEDDDMNPALIRALNSQADAFAKLGMPIRNIRSCINT